MQGTSANDTLSGGGGDDQIERWQGDDTLNGDVGNDSLLRPPGEGSCFGGDGHDDIADNRDAGYFDGRSGADTMAGSTMTAAMFGGGADTLKTGSVVQPLGVVIGTARDALLGRYVRTDRFQQVQLRGDLKHRARVGGVEVQIFHIRHDHRLPQRTPIWHHVLPLLGQRRHMQGSRPQPAPAGKAAQHPCLGHDLRLHSRPVVRGQSGQVVKPRHPQIAALRISSI